MSVKKKIKKALKRDYIVGDTMVRAKIRPETIWPGRVRKGFSNFPFFFSFSNEKNIKLLQFEARYVTILMHIK